MAELSLEIAQQVSDLIDAKIAEKVSAATRVVLGTAVSEFERLYMAGEDGKLSTAAFRQFLRWFEAIINGRVDALVEQKWQQLQNADEPS